MYMGSLYSPGLSANIFKKFGTAVTQSAKRIKAASQKVTKVYKKGKTFYKTYLRPDGTTAEVQITEAEAVSLAPETRGGLPAWVLPAGVALAAVTVFGAMRRRKA